LDYFNKAITPIDINGNPIIPKKHGKQDAHGAVTAIPIEGVNTGAGGGEDEEEEEDEQARAYAAVPRLPVDKGIFRRKMPPAPAVQEKPAGKDVPPKKSSGLLASIWSMTEGGQFAPRPSDAPPASTGAGANVDGGPESGAAGAGAGGDAGDVAGQSSKKSGPDSPKKGMAGTSSKRSLLSALGFGSGHTNSERMSTKDELLLKNDDNFLEHRKLLMRRWRENMQSKHKEMSGVSDSFFDIPDKEQLEVGNPTFLCGVDHFFCVFVCYVHLDFSALHFYLTSAGTGEGLQRPRRSVPTPRTDRKACWGGDHCFQRGATMGIC
jgi:hypothetical protein